MRRVLFFGGLALAVFSCTSGGNNTDASISDTSTTTTTSDGTGAAGAAGTMDTSTLNLGTGQDTGIGRTTTSGQDTAATMGGSDRRGNRQDSL